MSDIAMDEVSFASGRYSKRKRTQVTYFMDELDVSDSESDFEAARAKVRLRTALKPSHLTEDRNAKQLQQSHFPSAKSSHSLIYLARSRT